jgi:hypothetical protein
MNNKEAMMPVKYETILKVNEVQIELNEFAHEFITQIVICSVSMLKGGEAVTELVFNLEGNKPSLIINRRTVPLSAVPRDALVGTFTGMVSSLRGVNRVDKLEIELKAGDL